MAYATIDGCEVCYEATGEGRPLVFIHGLGGSTAIWRDVCQRLDGRFRVVAFDLRGAGRSRESRERDLSLDVWASDLRGLLAHLRISRPVLIGHSLGACVALKYALCWPDDVRALVLMGADAKLARLEPRMRQTAELVSELGLERWMENHWAKNPPFSTDSLARAPDILERYRAMVLGNTPKNYVRTCLAIASCEDLSATLACVRTPALVIVGGKDDRTRPEDGRRIAAELPGARLIELPSAGHSLPLEAPDEIATAIGRFVEDLDRWGAG